jgi:hypothetical protein
MPVIERPCAATVCCVLCAAGSTPSRWSGYPIMPRHGRCHCKSDWRTSGDAGVRSAWPRHARMPCIARISSEGNEAWCHVDVVHTAVRCVSQSVRQLLELYLFLKCPVIGSPFVYVPVMTNVVQLLGWNAGSLQ